MKAGRREGGRAGTSAGALALLLIGFPPSRLPAQKPAPVAATAPVAAKRVNPVGACIRSLLIPGWGQAQTGRNVEGALFVVVEGVAAMMTVRAVQEKKYLEATGSQSLDDKNQQIQDWAVLLGFQSFVRGRRGVRRGPPDGLPERAEDPRDPPRYRGQSPPAVTPWGSNCLSSTMSPVTTA